MQNQKLFFTFNFYYCTFKKIKSEYITQLFPNKNSIKFFISNNSFIQPLIFLYHLSEYLLTAILD